MRSNKQFAAFIWSGIASGQPEILRKRIADGTMTQQIWDSLTKSQRDDVMCKDDLHPLLIGLEGWRVHVIYKEGTEGVGMSIAEHWHRPRFIVGRTTGWKPCHLALRNINQRGSSDTLSAATPILSVRKIEKVR